MSRAITLIKTKGEARAALILWLLPVVFFAGLIIHLLSDGVPLRKTGLFMLLLLLAVSNTIRAYRRFQGFPAEGRRPARP
jgi:hypothetical protein